MFTLPRTRKARTSRGGVISEPATEIERRAEEAAGLPVLANRANEAHRAALDAARSALEHARDAGEALNEAKQRVAHGEWGEWLAEHFEASARTGQRYMRIADRWDELAAAGEADPPRVADLTLRAADRRLSEASEENKEPSSGRGSGGDDGAESTDRKESPDASDEALSDDGDQEAEHPEDGETTKTRPEADGDRSRKEACASANGDPRPELLAEASDLLEEVVKLSADDPEFSTQTTIMRSSISNIQRWRRALLERRESAS